MGDDRSYNFLIFAVVVFIVQAIWILFDLNLGPEPIIGNVLICLISFTAVIATFKVHKSIPKNFSKEKTALLFLLSAIILFFLGDLNWFIESISKFYFSYRRALGYFMVRGLHVRNYFNNLFYIDRV